MNKWIKTGEYCSNCINPIEILKLNKKEYRERCNNGCYAVTRTAEEIKELKQEPK